ncbi:hypothetical protein PENANT_c006G02876 [Penicillium antarcticum]|uniref:Uncharacterized protein n=1 Tax=Penicillium antarcticum TaxID=416450 RepID=A0A1V6QD58_9EURO|nr:hypothetical protein PENANT_c006G02876 [Penicillium antarcticum]
MACPGFCRISRQRKIPSNLTLTAVNVE